jgi:MFS family permease
LRAALGRKLLWGLLLGATMCTLLDEVVVALAALRMTRDLGASEVVTAASLSALSLGAVAGAAATELFVARTSARAVLIASACASAVALALVLLSRSPLHAVVALFLLGVSAEPQYPLLKAAAYNTVPGRPGLVNAAAQVFVALEIAVPLAVGVIATQCGLAVALASLALQPLVVLLTASFVLRMG